MTEEMNLSKLAVEDFPKFKEVLKRISVGAMLEQKQEILALLYEQMAHLPPSMIRQQVEAMCVAGIAACMSLIDNMQNVNDFFRYWPKVNETITDAINQCMLEIPKEAC